MSEIVVIKFGIYLIGLLFIVRAMHIARHYLPFGNDRFYGV